MGALRTKARALEGELAAALGKLAQKELTLMDVGMEHSRQAAVEKNGLHAELEELRARVEVIAMCLPCDYYVIAM